MIILDTNFISELMLPNPNKEVAKWLSIQNPDTIFTTSISIAEILSGLELMPSGKRKRAMKASFKVIYMSLLEDSVLNFDDESAKYYSICNQLSRQHKLNIPQPDSFIAAICLQYGAELVTRNTKDFMHFGIVLINPWEEGKML
jgi:hypothetical protein